MSAAEELVDQTQYLTFRMAEEEYAIGILGVREIIEYGTLTKVPMTPIFIRGVINLRGSVVPVVDLAVKFGLPPNAVTRQTCIIIVEVDQEGEKTVMGVVADAVSEVMDLRPQDIETPPSFGTRVQVDYLRGLGRIGKKFVLILNVGKVLSAEELAELTSAEKAAGGAAPEAPIPGTAPESGKRETHALRKASRNDP